MFVGSALGVLVDQDETTSVDAPYVVDSLSYDAYGPVADAEGRYRDSTSLTKRDLKRLLHCLQKEASITPRVQPTSLLNTMVMTLMEMSKALLRPSQAMMKEMEKSIRKRFRM